MAEDNRPRGQCVDHKPAVGTPKPRAEALLASAICGRPSLARAQNTRGGSSRQMAALLH